MRRLEFWFEFGSTYSYLSVMRIEDLAARHDVTVEWKPFLLGAVFKAQGWETSPFNIYEDKGRYMWRDVARRAAKYGLEFHRLPHEGPARFPQNGLYAARMALVALEQPWGEAFCKSVFVAQFADGEDIGTQEKIDELACRHGARSADIGAARSQRIKDVLRVQTEIAVTKGIFGAPSFVVGDELFWGDDRLEDAIAFAVELP